MKIDITQEALAEAISVAGRVVPTKSTLPVLSNVLLEVDGTGELVVSGTDLEVGTRHRVKATVWAPGRTTLPARLLADYVALLDHGTNVTLELNDKTHKMHLECGRQIANISTIDAEDFPPFGSAEGMTFTLPAGTLKGAISQVAFAAATDDSRPVLAGVLVQVRNNVLSLAAADGFRLAVRDITLREPTPDLTILVPSTPLKELARILPDEDGEPVTISVAQNGSAALFAWGPTEIKTRLIEGQFPDYKRIIPSTSLTTIRISTADMVRATRASAVFARDNSNIVRLSAQPETSSVPSTLQVQSTSAEMGDNTGTLEAVVEGDSNSIAFNGKYLRDALEAIDTPDVLIQVQGASSPGVIRPTGDLGETTTYVIMPMHVAR